MEKSKKQKGFKLKFRVILITNVFETSPMPTLGRASKYVVK
jgi:hypothetical protein